MKKKGKICLSSLTSKVGDDDRLAHIVINGWNMIARFCPLCVGGCRPIDLHYPFNAKKTLFVIIYEQIYIQFGLPSQIVIAQRHYV